jgi:hypothetical protein
MQVFVKTLVQNGDSPIVALYEEGVTLPSGAHSTSPDGTVPIYMRGIDQQYINAGPPMMLLQNWRDQFNSVVDSEATRRINDVFPAQMQASASLLRQNDIISYGSDVTTWPPDQQDKNTEIQRGTDYITAVNAAAATVKTNAPVNPCDDQYWPAPITPISL